MATPLTRAQQREAVRRDLQIQTPFGGGVAGALEGDAPPGQPDPSNDVINDYLNKGIDAVNRVCRVGPITTKSVSVPAMEATHRRKQYVDISSVLTSAVAASEIEDIWFKEDGTNYTYSLEPWKYYDAAKKFQAFPQLAPGRPAQFVVSGPQIVIIPPSDRSGTLYFDVAQGIPQFAADADTIAFLPIEYQIAVEIWAVLLCCARNGQDAEAQARMQGFAPMGMQLLQQIYQWKNGYDDDGIETVRETLMMIPGLDKAMRAAAQQPAQPQGQGQGQ